MHTHTHNQHCLDRSSSHKPTTLLITTNTFETNSLSLARQIKYRNTQNRDIIRSETPVQTDSRVQCAAEPVRDLAMQAKQIQKPLSLSLSLSGFSAKRFAWSVSLKAAAAATRTTWSVFSSRRNLQCHKIDCRRKGSGGYLDRLTACQRNACAKIQ
jgi:hypothetical protein